MQLPPLLQVGGVRVTPPLLLAPMAGITHSAFRLLVAEIGGCGLLATEMLSARSVPHEDPHRSPWLKRDPREGPIAYQLLLAHPKEVPAAADKVIACGADVIDINMGCTAALVIKRGGGVALRRDPVRAAAIVRTLRRRTDLPLTAKIRLGWPGEESSLVDFCRRLQDAGLDALTVHPRLKTDRLKRPARWHYIGRLKQALEIPVIGNGDVDSAAAASKMFAETGCDGIMIGRAAARSPWIFAQIAAALWRQPLGRIPAPPDVYQRFVDLLTRQIPTEYQLSLLKKFTFYFAGNYLFGHTLWRRVSGAASISEACARAADFFASQQPLPP